jgi:HK97 family phage prohead protease
MRLPPNCGLAAPAPATGMPRVTAGASLQTMKTEAAFTYDTVIDAKSVKITETDDGDLIVEGWATDFDPDRDDEAFEPGAFDQGVKSYLETNPVLLYNHRFGPSNAVLLGAVEKIERRVMDSKSGKQGMWIRAVVARAEPNTEAADAYNKVKRGMLRGFSFGGKFYRRMVSGATKIWKADIMETSLTPVPANPRALGVVAAKAFSDDDFQTGADPNLEGIEEALDRLDRFYSRLT